MYFKPSPFHAQVVFQVLVISLHSSVKIDQKITWVFNFIVLHSPQSSSHWSVAYYRTSYWSAVG